MSDQIWGWFCVIFLQESTVICGVNFPWLHVPKFWFSRIISEKNSLNLNRHFKAIISDKQIFTTFKRNTTNVCKLVNKSVLTVSFQLVSSIWKGIEF